MSRPPDPFYNRLIGSGYRFHSRRHGARLGTAYDGRDENSGQPIWIQVLPAMTSRAAIDADITLLASQPLCAPILAAVAEESFTFVVSALPPGYTLEDELTRGPLPPVRALAIGAALAGAVAELHEQGLVHGAVVAPLVIVGTPESATSVATAQLRLLGAGVRGVADERPEAERPTAADDVEQCGELLTQMLLLSHQNLDVLPAPLMALIARATAPDPAMRPSAAEFARACRDLAAELSPERLTTAQPPAPPPPTLPPGSMPTNWSPPPPRPPFVYGQAPAAPLQPLPGAASAGPPAQSGRVRTIALLALLLVATAVIVWWRWHR